jgi:RNA polymerase sigma factor (sigma-70 family)
MAPAVAAKEADGGTEFETFFRSEYTRLVRALYLLTGSRSDAEDVAQEAMARVYERWGRVGRMERPAGYLYRVALHLDRRRRYRLALQARKLRPDPSEAPDPSAVAEAKSDVLRALLALPRDQREVLVLIGWLGMGGAQAANVLGAKPSTVRARSSRARTAFRAKLGEGYE